MALILFRLGFIILGAALAVILLAIAKRNHLRWWPAAVIRIILVLMVLLITFSARGEIIRSQVPPREIMVIDFSASNDPAALFQLQESAIDWEAQSDGRLIILAADSINVLLNPVEAWPLQSQSETNLVEALETAEMLLGKVGGKIILASDGQVSNMGEVTRKFTQFASQGIEVELLPLASRNIADDRSLEAIISPTHQWENTPFEIQVPIFNGQPGDINHIKLLINGEMIEGVTREITSGVFGVMVPPQTGGILSIEVSLATPNDPNMTNNSAYSIIQIYSTPPVLIVSTNDSQGMLISTILASQKIPTAILRPDEIPTDITALQKYKVIFLQNMQASNLSYETMNALKVFVTDLGGGLVFTGGNYSYTLGDYKNTILEPLFPVKLEPPPRPNRTPLTYLIILDRSGSMQSENRPTRVKSIDLAREAAMRSLETMRPNDYLGLITYETEVVWDVPIELIGDGMQLRQAMDVVSSIRAGGTTSMFLALSTGLDSLINLPLSTPQEKNILLLTDGKSSDGSYEEFQELAEIAKIAGINISTIGVGDSTDEDLLCMLAETTEGRCYPVVLPVDLPRIMVAESEAIRSENIQTGLTTLLPGEESHPILSGLQLDQLPSTQSYNALSSKAAEGAEDVLVSANFGDPILAVWQYGLGRVAAWMTDVGEFWAEPWNNPEDEHLFWSQVVRYTLVNPAIGPVQVTVDALGKELEISVRIENKNSTPLNLARVDFTYVTRESKEKSIVIPQTSPGNYYLTLPQPSPGTYQASISFEEKAGHRTILQMPFAVNSLGENPKNSEHSGEAVFEQWTQDGFADRISLENLVDNPEKLSGERAAQVSDSLWLFLLGFVMFWPIEIAVRRQWLPWLS